MQAIPARLVLTSDTDTITIRPEWASSKDPVICKQWDLGAPDVRANAADRTNADGVMDTSGFTGARTVTLELLVFGDAYGSPYAYAERLAAMAHPYRRPKLQITRAAPESAGQTWELELRGNPYSLAYGQRAAAMLEMQLSFTAPKGYLEGDYQSFDAQPQGSGGTGVTFPLSFPLGTGNSGTPILVLAIGGSAPVAPQFYIYGPVSNPVISDDLGNVFSLQGLTVNSGDVVQIDMDTGSVLLNGSANASLFQAVDWSVSSFWRWFPGHRTVRFNATSGVMSVYWRDRRFTI